MEVGMKKIIAINLIVVVMLAICGLFFLLSPNKDLDENISRAGTATYHYTFRTYWINDPNPDGSEYELSEPNQSYKNSLGDDCDKVTGGIDFHAYVTDVDDNVSQYTGNTEYIHFANKESDSNIELINIVSWPNGENNVTYDISVYASIYAGFKVYPVNHYLGLRREQKEFPTTLKLNASDFKEDRVTMFTETNTLHSSGWWTNDDYYWGFYAVFAPCQYQVTFNANGGKIGGESSVKTTQTYLEPYILPETPVREGYRFQSWSVLYTYEQIEEGDLVTTAANHTLRAEWEPITTTITLEKNGGTGGVDSVIATFDSAMPTITVPTRTGYVFNGYYIDESNNNGKGTKYYNSNGTSARRWDIDTSSDTLYASWNPKSYRINFDAGDGKVSPTYKNVEFGEEITLPTPTRAGYSFAGWKYGDSTITDMSYTVPDFGANGVEVEFEAQWSKEGYTINYDAKGGSVSPNSATVSYGDSITLPTPTRTGYTFTDWEYDGEIYSGSYTVPDFGDNKEEVTFTAQWSKESYRINYEVGEGSVSPTYDDVDYGESITLPTPTPPTGYKFINWEYNGDTYSGSYTVPDFGDNKEEVTFTAQWEKEDYTIEYDANGGSVSPNSVTVNYGDNITLPTPSRTAYTFTGWRYGNTNYTGLYIVPDFGDDGASVTFTAHWTANKYKVTFDEDGGNSVSDISNYTIESTISFPSTTKAGYDFVNWKVTKADGNWTNGATFNANTTTTGKYGNVTLTAQWNYHTYTVTLDPNGGEVSPPSIRVTYQSTYGSLPTPTRDGYVFKGWYTSETSGTQILSTTKYTSTQDTTIFAQWQDTWANHASDALTSEDGYYFVSSEEDLARVSYLLNCTDRTDVQTMKFKLTKNLDMSDYTWLPIGTQSRQFRGTFEGNGYIISGLNTYYNSSISSTYTNIGLFGYVNGATIQNLYLRDTDMRGGSNVGGLIGYATGNTQVTSCAFDGDITANSNGGSIVGLGATSVIVSNCTVFSSNTTANTNGMARGCSVRSLVYITNGTKGYIGTDFTGFVFVEGMPAPVPTGLSWLAQGGEPCDLADIEEWASEN